MEVNLKEIGEFPNWALAVEFLRRSPVHFLLTRETPPEDVRDTVRAQILVQGAPAGVDYLGVPADFDKNQILAICTALATQAAHEPHHYFGSIRSSNFVAFLREFAKMLQGKFEMAEVAQAITDKTCELFEAEGASILTPNRDQTRFRFAFHRTIDEATSRRLDVVEVPADRGVTGWVARNRRSILVRDVTTDPLFNPDIDRSVRFETRDIIAAPIEIGDRLLAILEVVNKRDGSFRESDLRIIELIASIIAVFIEKAQLYDDRLRFAKVQRELEIAHELQTQVMPALPSRIGPFLLGGESLQLSRVGGDFWDVYELSPHEKLLVIGDVSGHGLSAALVMSAVRTAMRAMLHLIKTPYALIEPLNYLIHEQFGANGHYVTLILCHLIVPGRRVNYFRAGHEHPVLHDENGYRALTNPGGLPLGLFSARQHDPWIDLQLGENDQLYLYTDGVLDGLPEHDMAFDELMSRHPQLTEALDRGAFFATLRRDLGWKDQDDATILRLSAAY